MANNKKQKCAFVTARNDIVMKNEYILDEYIEVNLNGKNANRYKELGYKINDGDKKITVKVLDLPPNSEHLINVRCSKCDKVHKKAYRHLGSGTLCPDCSPYQHEIKKCQFCGEETVRTYNGLGICNRHRYQVARYGHVIKGRYDSNKYIEHDDYVEIELWYKGEVWHEHALIDKCDYDKVKQYRWHLEKVNENLYYVTSHIEKKSIRLHKLILENAEVVDHINHNGLDNRRCNLRACSAKENSRNLRTSKNTYSGIRGVTYDKSWGKWIAYISNERIGAYDNLEDASNARIEKALSDYGEFANIEHYYDNTIKIAGFHLSSVTDGVGFRDVCFIQGCWFNCQDCQNPQTHSIDGGETMIIKDVVKKLGTSRNEITISGGDGLTYQIRETYELIKELKLKYGKNIWVYTGFKFEDLLKDVNPIRQEVLKYIDVLVDGKFNYKIKDKTCAFKGDPSQRIINVQESLKQNKVVLYED